MWRLNVMINTPSDPCNLILEIDNNSTRDSMRNRQPKRVALHNGLYIYFDDRNLISRFKTHAFSIESDIWKVKGLAKTVPITVTVITNM